MSGADTPDLSEVRNVFNPSNAKVATIFSPGLTRKMTEYRLCMLRQEDGLSKKDRHDMSLLSHSPRGRASGFIRDERFTFESFGCNHNERNQKHRSTALSERRHPPRTHAFTHTFTHTSTTSACLSAHEHTLTKGDQSMTIGSCHFRQRQVGEECSSNRVP